MADDGLRDAGCGDRRLQVDVDVIPLSRNRYTRSSVAMLPLAPGANGQPPRPPTDASSRVTPALTAA